MCQEENNATSSSNQELETAILKTRETLRALKKQVSELHCCQLSRFSWKLHNFEAHFTRLLIFWWNSWISSTLDIYAATNGTKRHR